MTSPSPRAHLSNPPRDSENTAAQLRAAMVERLRGRQLVASERVAAAMRTVPRHLFVPVALAEAYADRAVTIKADRVGRPLSCASEPGIVAMMLDQLDARPGMRILEIGAGTGYNAALLAELGGPTGDVTTLDIDPEVTAHARATLSAAGYPRVRVIAGDGAPGAPAYAPFDRIIATVGVWDLPPAWPTQLAANGRLVAPLRWRGQTRSIAFVREQDHLVSDSIRPCGFIPMAGRDQDGERTASIDPNNHVTLRWDTDQPLDPTALQGTLNQPPTTRWSDTIVDPTESFDGVWLHLAIAEPGCCRITADHTAVTAGRCTPAITTGSPALIEDTSLAYLTLRHRSTATGGLYELGATGHGPTGPLLAARLCGHITAWGHDRTALPLITVHATATDAKPPPAGQTIHKQHTRLVFSWPTSENHQEPTGKEARDTPSPSQPLDGNSTTTRLGGPVPGPQDNASADEFVLVAVIEDPTVPEVFTLVAYRPGDLDLLAEQFPGHETRMLSPDVLANHAQAEVKAFLQVTTGADGDSRDGVVVGTTDGQGGWATWELGFFAPKPGPVPALPPLGPEPQGEPGDKQSQSNTPDHTESQ